MTSPNPPASKRPTLIGSGDDAGPKNLINLTKISSAPRKKSFYKTKQKLQARKKNFSPTSGAFFRGALETRLRLQAARNALVLALQAEAQRGGLAVHAVHLPGRQLVEVEPHLLLHLDGSPPEKKSRVGPPVPKKDSSPLDQVGQEGSDGWNAAAFFRQRGILERRDGGTE